MNETIEPIQSVVFKSSHLTIKALAMLQIEPIQSVVFKYHFEPTYIFFKILNLYRVLYLNTSGLTIFLSILRIEPIQSVVFKLFNPLTIMSFKGY